MGRGFGGARAAIAYRQGFSVFRLRVFPKTRRPLRGGYTGYVGVSRFYSIGFISVWLEES